MGIAGTLVRDLDGAIQHADGVAGAQRGTLQPGWAGRAVAHLGLQRAGEEGNARRLAGPAITWFMASVC